MPRLVAMLIVASAVLPMAATANEPKVDGYYSGRIIVTDRVEGEPGHEGGAGGQTGRRVFSYWRVAPSAQGYCRERGSTTDEGLARAYNYLYERRGAEANAAADFPECPKGAAVAAPPSPGELARDFWDVRRLPSPRLTVVPDDTIVGKRVFLQIGGPTATSFDVANPIGAPVAIAATSRYVVDWGDGTSPVTTTSQGGPWPDGDLTHVYDTSSPGVTIRVAQQWSATWTAGPGASGRLENLRTEGELTLRVDQLQPVRNR